MTIAACYLSSEGVVLGADSTASAAISPGPGMTGFHYYNHNQKLFEIGEGSTLGAITWGVGSLGPKSHRTLLALLADDIEATKPASVGDAMQRWCTMLWTEYQAAFADGIRRCKELSAKSAYGAPVAAGQGQIRTDSEEREFQALKTGLVLGFCIAGYLPPDRSTTAYEVICDPLAASLNPSQIPHLSYKFWGAPNLVQRLIFGADDGLKAAILGSGKWGGTEADLGAIMAKQVLGHPILPIRDAVDFVHTCIYSTIKAMKFSNFYQICGGPIELAVISTDRKFRWVRHKPWDSAIEEG